MINYNLLQACTCQNDCTEKVSISIHNANIQCFFYYFFLVCVFGHMITWKLSTPWCKKIFTFPLDFLFIIRNSLFPSFYHFSLHPSFAASVWLTPSCRLLLPLCSADIPHSKPRRWGVRDPAHLSGSRHSPHSLRCGLPLWRAVRPRPPQQRGRAGQCRGGRRRPLLRLHVCQRLLPGPGAPESGRHLPVRRQRSAGILTGNGEQCKSFEWLRVSP